MTTSNAILNALKACQTLANNPYAKDYFTIPLSIYTNGENSISILGHADNEDFGLDFIAEGDEVELHRNYHNAKHLDMAWIDDDFYVGCNLPMNDLDYTAKFLTDYILYLNPTAKVSDIVTEIIFSLYTEDESKNLVFTADSPYPTPERLDEAMRYYPRCIEE